MEGVIDPAKFELINDNLKHNSVRRTKIKELSILVGVYVVGVYGVVR